MSRSSKSRFIQSATLPTLLFVALLLAASVWQPVTLLAAEESKVKVETIVSDLVDPCGIAIQPSTENVFVSDSGAGRIVEVLRMKPDQAIPVITGFVPEKSTAIQDVAVHLGALGLAFLNEHTLVVGNSSKKGDRTVLVFNLPVEATGNDAKPLEADSAKQRLGGPAEGEETVAAEGKFYGLAVSPFAPPALFATNPGSSRGWIFKAQIKSWSSLEKLNPFTFIPAKVVSRVGLPSGGITINRRGLLVVGMANADPSKGSSVAFFNAKPETGGLLTTLPTTLHRITGLAYSPESGRLYAADFGDASAGSDGIYRLDAATVDGRSGIKAVKVAAVDRPTALVFSSDNTLFATAFGSIDKESKNATAPKAGKLVKITGDL